jgi:hypothetical protein
MFGFRTSRMIIWMQTNFFICSLCIYTVFSFLEKNPFVGMSPRESYVLTLCESLCLSLYHHYRALTRYQHCASRGSERGPFWMTYSGGCLHSLRLLARTESHGPEGGRFWMVYGGGCLRGPRWLAQMESR